MDVSRISLFIFAARRACHPVQQVALVFVDAGSKKHQPQVGVYARTLSQQRAIGLLLGLELAGAFGLQSQSK